MPSTITTPNTIIGFLPDGKPVYEIRGGAPDPIDPPAPDPVVEPVVEPEPEVVPEDEADLAKARAKISKLNGENAGWRTQLREAQDQLKNAKTVEEFEAARTELEGRIAEKDAEIFTRDRALVIATHRLPKELADLLPTEGKTVEELTALAAGLAKFVPEDPDEIPEELGGGLTGGKKTASTNETVAADIRKRRNRRF